jgi:hypothetical protein
MSLDALVRRHGAGSYFVVGILCSYKGFGPAPDLISPIAGGGFKSFPNLLREYRSECNVSL